MKPTYENHQRRAIEPDGTTRRGAVAASAVGRLYWELA
jgi:hypothetical protein